MVIIVYSTRQLCAHISDVDTAMVGCGYAGVMGNKVGGRTSPELGDFRARSPRIVVRGGTVPWWQGAVGVRFLLGGDGNKANGRSICFVNSHLNAHAHMVKRRQEDYERLVEKQRRGTMRTRGPQRSAVQRSAGPWSRTHPHRTDPTPKPQPRYQP